jgi:hypothetical protein
MGGPSRVDSSNVRMNGIDRAVVHVPLQGFGIRYPDLRVRNP